MSQKNNIKIYLGILGSYALYLLFSFSSWHEPIMGDEVTYALFVRGLVHPGIMRFFQADQPAFGLWHPPLYALVLSLLEKYFVFNASTARLISLASFLISLFLIYGISRELFKNDPKKSVIGLCACLLFSLNPLAVRGSLLIDMDGTMLNVAVLGFVYLLLIYQDRHPRFIGHFLCAAGLALCFWIKLATPIFLIGSFVLYFCLVRDFDKAGRMIKVVVAGLILFSISWFFYAWARGINYWSVWGVPLMVARGFFERTGVPKDKLSLIRNVWALLIWCSPSFILLGLISLGKIFLEPSRQSKEENLISLRPFAFYGIVVFCAYFLVGGVTHSFPKYHYAILPVFVIAISGFVMKNINFDRRLFLQMACLVAGLVIFNVVGAGDPLYTINYAFKENMILKGGFGARAYLMKELIQMSFLFMTIPMAYLFFKGLKRPNAWLLSLVASALACHLALSIVQMKAPYNTVYCYGANKVEAAAKFVRSHTRMTDRKICAPLEILWLANEDLSSYLTASHLKSREAFLNMLKKEDLVCVVYGVSGNTIEQYKTIFNQAEVQSFLNAAYQGTTIGSYQIWLKK